MRFVGDRVAFVVAETLAQARDAAELVEVDYEPLPAVVDYRRRRQGRRAEGVGRQSERQRRLPPDVRRPGGDRRGLRQGQARRQAARREQPAVAGVDGAARRDRRLQRGRRQLHALHLVAESARRAHGDRRTSSTSPENQMRVVVARRRRRLRPEGRLVPRRRAGAVGLAQAAAAR